MIKEEIYLEISNAIQNLVNLEKIPKDAVSFLEKISLVKPKNSNFGDFSSNISLILAQGLNKNPKDISLLIKAELEKNSKYLSKIEVAGVGFLNFTLNNYALYFILKYVIKNASTYGKNIQKNPKKILLEFVSANPTGGLHLGHARPSFMGDAVARLLRAAGFLVTTEFYVNDAGNQVEILGRTIYKRYRELFGEKIEILKGEYPSEQIKEIAKAIKERDGDSWLNKSEEDWLFSFIKFGVEFNLSLIKRSLKAVSIEMDNWFFESTLHDSLSLKELVDIYDKRGMLYEAKEAMGSQDKIRREDSKSNKFSHLQEGGIFLKTSIFGDDEDRIIKRKDGRFVYLTADLAYHRGKFERGFDKIINVFGADHSGHIKRITAGMEALGYEKNRLNFILVQIVRLLKDGKEAKFSKRSGEVSSFDDLINIIGSDAARFIFLMRSCDSQFDFDIDLVLSQGHENPVFYIQYGHARMATILNKAKEYNLPVNEINEVNMSKLTLQEEREILLKISELPYIIKEAAESYEPHKLIFYCQEIVKIFHSYFTKYRSDEKIISDDKDKSIARLALVYALKQTLHNALLVLGINAPDFMEKVKYE